MFFNRVIANHVKEAINGEKRVVIVYGPRQAGKTTLMKSLFLETKNNRVQFFVGDDLYVQDLFKRNDLEALKRAAGSSGWLFGYIGEDVCFG